MAEEERFSISTKDKFQIVDITQRVERIVDESGIKSGLCTILLPHATAALILEENESGLREDILNWVKKEFPPNSSYNHNRIDSNAHAHLASGFIGQSKTLPIKNGKLVRGTWQNLLLIELDGPRSKRNVIVKIIEG